MEVNWQSENWQELKRFQTLQAEIASAANDALERFREDSKKTTLRLVDMESSYLTVDFFRKLPMEAERGGNPTANDADRYTEGHFRRIGSNVSSYILMVSETLRISIPKAVVYCQVREAKRSLLDHFYTQIGKKEVNWKTLHTTQRKRRRKEKEKKSPLTPVWRNILINLWLNLIRCQNIMAHLQQSHLLDNVILNNSSTSKWA